MKDLCFDPIKQAAESPANGCAELDHICALIALHTRQGMSDTELVPKLARQFNYPPKDIKRIIARLRAGEIA